MKRMVWFTADLHFGHEAVITMQNRPFHDAHEMNDVLIRPCLNGADITGRSIHKA